MCPLDAPNDSVISTMRFDGLGRRIGKTVTNSADLDCPYAFYYDGQRMVETRNGSDQVITQHVWGLTYVDELAQVGHNDDPADVEQLCESFYWSCQDANYNVLGLVDSEGVLVERSEYTPYGQRTVFFSPGLNDPGCNASTSISRRRTYAGENQPWGLCAFGHQGLMHDEETGNIYNRARMLSPNLGRFMQRDPLGYVDGMGLYEYEQSSPHSGVDPDGSWKIERKGQRLATAVAEINCESIDALAKQAGLDPVEAQKWLSPYKRTNEVSKGDVFYIPNKVYAYMGDTSGKVAQKKGWGSAYKASLYRLEEYAGDMRAMGYEVVIDYDMQFHEVHSVMGDSAIHGLFIIAHGDLDRGLPIDVDGKMLKPLEDFVDRSHHRIAFFTLMACNTEKRIGTGGDVGWMDTISPYGILRVPSGKLWPDLSGWYDVRVVYDGSKLALPEPPVN